MWGMGVGEGRAGADGRNVERYNGEWQVTFCGFILKFI
jgi:hypothetical protein